MQGSVSLKYAIGRQSEELLNKERELAKRDLEFHFGIQSSIHFRDIECLVVKLKDKGKLLPSADSVESFEKTLDGSLVIRNSTIDPLLIEIGDTFGDFNGINEMPIIDETGFKEKFSANIKMGETLEELNNELSKFGFEVKKEIRNIKCLILKEI
ncbi:hypothetical protein [Pedobacter frigoris]|uniref:Uncharacterized protein n=1 Tax=Pedobacter frigoris TaxID=2571272 RepID=A0A4U1CQH4_9SPHI|nr:hypothetical protein [Pedobacter frigoris]TKC07684.1 hypothetical protein FA047_10655 [Pedobacter frigoris]